jgi:2-dehydro-3-deoxygluconokinase
MRRVLCAGECMIEVRYLNAVTAGISYAGDTYNTAVYLRRTADVLGTDLEVGYLTGLGDDEDSLAMRNAWAAEAIVDRSVRLDGLLPGLYTVRVDNRCERRFSYWRSSSAARQLFAGTDWVEQLKGDVIHLSGITLQLASPAARETLQHRLAALRDAGTLISLDTNYRAAGWSSPDQAAQAMDEVAKIAGVVFATFDDEAAIHGCRSVSEAADRLVELGVPEVVVKSGADGARVIAGGRTEDIAATPVEHAVDTTAAGDAFAGGYLAARLADQSAAEAARMAADVAAAVVSHPGAIIPRTTRLIPFHPSR